MPGSAHNPSHTNHVSTLVAWRLGIPSPQALGRYHWSANSVTASNNSRYLRLSPSPERVKMRRTQSEHNESGLLPESRHLSGYGFAPLWAITGLMRCSK